MIVGGGNLNLDCRGMLPSLLLDTLLVVQRLLGVAGALVKQVQLPEELAPFP